MSVKIYEQADPSTTALCGAVYSWLLCGVKRRTHLSGLLLSSGWKWTAGRPGCWVTNDPEAAAAASDGLVADVVTNGSHARLGVPVLLCDQLAV